MARRVGPKKARQYSLEFKLKAVKLSQLKGVQVQAVAEALEIHPFTLSKWGKDAREGTLRGRVFSRRVESAPPVAPTMRRFQALRRAHALLEEEHTLLQKLIRFTSARRPTGSRSSTKNESGSV